MITPQEVLHIGTILKPHGKQGDLQCRMDNEYWQTSSATFILINMDNILIPWRVSEWWEKGNDLIFSLHQVCSEEQALPLCGKELLLLRCDMAEDQQDSELSWQDIVGWQLATLHSQPKSIVRIDDSTANILAELEDGTLVPLHEDLISLFDEENHIIHIQIQL